MHRLGYIDVILTDYPGKQVVISGDDMRNYSAITWVDGIPITQTELDEKLLNLERFRLTQKVRIEATEQRMYWQETVLGSNDKYQERTYDEKYKEAVAYLADPATPTPIMTHEVFHTGETINDLALLVVSQYEAAKATLCEKFGDIEGRRRKYLADISAITNLTELDNFVITWA